MVPFKKLLPVFIVFIGLVATGHAANGPCHEYRAACKSANKKKADVARCVEERAQAAGNQACLAKVAKLKAKRAEKRAAKRAHSGSESAPAASAPAAH